MKAKLPETEHCCRSASRWNFFICKTAHPGLAYSYAVDGLTLITFWGVFHPPITLQQTPSVVATLEIFHSFRLVNFVQKISRKIDRPNWRKMILQVACGGH